MELTQNQKIKKYVSYCLILAVLDLIQNTAGLSVEIFGARCFLLLPAAIIFAMGEDILGGTMVGLFAGLLWDLTSGIHMGFNCVYIALMCFIASALASNIARDTFITNMIMCIVTISIYCTVYWLFFIIIKGVEGAEDTILSFYFPCGIYTTLISPIMWLILNPVKKKLNLINNQDFR